MGAIPNPATYPTQQILNEFLPLSFDIAVQQNGVAVDLTASSLGAPVFSGNEKVGELIIDRTNQATGVIKFSIDSNLYGQLGGKSTWYFFENTVFGFALVRGTLVKAD